MGSKKQKYMNPITFEAELFVHNLEILSETHKHIDVVLVASLEKVMNAIEKFLDSNTVEIVDTSDVKLVECENVSAIKRIYHCEHCKTDLGKSVEKVTLHLIAQCPAHKSNQGAAARALDGIRHASRTSLANDREQKNARSKLCSARPKQMNENIEIKLTKKARALLTMDLNPFFKEHLEIATKLKCLPEYDEIQKDLLDAIAPTFQNKKIKIYKFGSRLAGIGTRESDLDLYIDIGDTFSIFRNRADDEVLSKLKKVARALENHNMWKGLVKVETARVPIVKVLHARSGLECDINFSNGLGTINTNFLEYIFNIQPIARLLCIFLKKWMSRTKINDAMNTYSLILMVLFYLQTVEVLPSMKRLQQNINEGKVLTVGPWLYKYATFSVSELNIPLEALDLPNILKFIRLFFIFYKDFKFKNDVICPYLGKVVRKTDVEKYMPSRYIEYVNSSPQYALDLCRPIVVQDPLQLNHNTTKGLSSGTLQIIQTLMARSLEVLNEAFPV